MREYTLYIWVGVWLVILPFLGIPGSWKTALTALTGLFLIGVALARFRLGRAIEPTAPEGSRVTEETEEQNPFVSNRE